MSMDMEEMKERIQALEKELETIKKNVVYWGDVKNFFCVLLTLIAAAAYIIALIYVFFKLFFK